MNNYSLFLKKVKEIGDYISSQSYIRIFSHNDADGIVSASIIMKTLNKKKIKYHITFVSKIDIHFINQFHNELLNSTVLFLDIGCGSFNLLSNYDNIVILDHHKYNNKLNSSCINNYILNSEDFNISGSFYACASSICYIVSKCIDSENIKLSSLALVGIDGDRQLYKYINEVVLNDAKNNGLIDERYGYKFGDGNLYDIFFTSIEPYLDINGDKDKIKTFFLSIGLENKKVSSLSSDELNTFKLCIRKELEKYGCESSIEFIFGVHNILKNSLISNIHEFSTLLMSCSQLNRPSLGVSLCFNNHGSLIEAHNILTKTKNDIFSEFLIVYNTRNELEYLCYFIGENILSAGEIASSISRYCFCSKSIICFNITNSNIKVSGRCTMKLVSSGVDLSLAFNEAAQLVGGTGGGHSIASGGIIPLGTIDKFVNRVNLILKNQLTINEK